MQVNVEALRKAAKSTDDLADQVVVSSAAGVMAYPAQYQQAARDAMAGWDVYTGTCDEVADGTGKALENCSGAVRGFGDAMRSCAALTECTDDDAGAQIAATMDRKA
ncbi:hypothetical protein [Segniliparus rugosus]|uniref:Excreted virulence factor EspC, type VII ESX diderm n=1 Tax=Segniliparus rugosus (strain ATCC BAA-974 / DSM 45345 / CCUG 50838 / CIP 108380 / JCM 13579 / CDC 945) TaxID=679197 RepID=E5XT44_SEGRC|nr:hypothetical protein [Segniliparus rugosus]EFV12455.1 hypothetical protein HMPREF9336_02666 [Segniliparus rugosus ATCC BAA-974]